MGLHRRPRHRSDGRTCLGVRALRIRLGGWTRGQLRQQSVDPIFKFDRNTGEILANFGAGTFVTPHGIYADGDGNVWVTDFAGNDEGTKGHQVHKFSPTGELLMSLGVAGQPGKRAGSAQPAQ